MKERLVLPLDVDSIEECKEIIEDLKDDVGYFKVNAIFTREGPKVVDLIKKNNCKVFLDLKYHDIPFTVANYARQATRLGVDIFDIHASGGYEMMKSCVEAAKDEADKLGKEKPMILAITVLTSLDESALKEMNLDVTPEEQVKTLALLAKKAGVDGVVASAKETKMIKEACGDDFKVLTPGIRPEWSVKDDQKRVVTPKQAIENGSDFIVIGRPIVKAENRKEAARKVIEEMNS